MLNRLIELNVSD